MKTLKYLTLGVLACSLTLHGCKKDEEEENNENGGSENETGTGTETGNTTEERNYYFKATIGGSSVEYKEGVDEFTAMMAYSSSGVEGDKYVGQTFGLATSLDSPPGGYATIVKYFGLTSEETCDAFKSMFKVGSYDFGSTNTKEEGAKVFYYDDAGVYWATDLGNGNASGSSFEITEHEEVDGWGYEAITKATFDCWLYNDAGDSTRADGEIRSVTVQCF